MGLLMSKEQKLLHACFKGKTAVVESLLKELLSKSSSDTVDAKEKYKAAFGNLSWEYEDAEQGFKAIHMAVAGGKEEIVSMLIKAGADVNEMTTFIDRSDGVFPIPPLFISASYGHEKIFHMLLDAGADLFAKTKEGETALHAACCCPLNPVNLNIVKFLLDKKFDPNLRTIKIKSHVYGFTPFHFAAMHSQDRQVIFELFKAGGNDLHKNSIGDTPSRLKFSAAAGPNTILDVEWNSLKAKARSE